MAKKPPSPNPFVPFFPGDRATAPMGLEESSESAWQRFEELHKAHEQPFAPTEPGPPPTSNRGFAPTQPNDGSKPAKRAPPPKRKDLTLDQVMVLARRNNRACPQPAAWAQLYALLPPRERAKGDPLPPPPPIDGPAWSAVSPMQKRLRLRDQIEWAEEAGVLAAVHDFLAALPDESWLYM